MSGPKVLRIVTREELLELCQGHIAQLEEALREWERIGSTNQIIDDSDRAQLNSKLREIKQLLAADQFLEVQKRAPRLIESVRHDMSQRVEERYAAKAAARRREKSLRFSAKQLYDQLRKADVALPVALQDRLSAASVDGTFPAADLQQVVADALRLLSESESSLTSEKQSELVRELKGLGQARTLDDWLASSQSPADAPIVKTLDRYIAQLATCDQSSELSELTARVELANAEKNEPHRKMLLDSLCLEAAAAVRRGHNYLKLKQEAADELAAIVASGDIEFCREAVQHVESSLATRDFVSAQEHLAHLKQLRATAAQRRAAQASRASLLKGLKELGYSVSEGMTTAWSRNKRLVVRHPTMSGVALELGEIGQNNQFQARVVAVQGEGRDSTTDQQVETVWCNELSRIRTRVADWGGEIKINVAIPAGAQALKIVALEQRHDEDKATEFRSRTLD